MPRELEHRIQQLCARMAATHDDEELFRLCEELQAALKEHVSFLRERVADLKGLTQKIAPKKGDKAE